MAQADGQVLIDTKIGTDGLEKGFERMIKSLDRVGDHVEKIGALLEKAFSSKNAVTSLNEVSSAAQKCGDDINRAFSGADTTKPFQDAKEIARESADSITRAFENVDISKPINKGLINAKHRVDTLESQVIALSNVLDNMASEGKTPKKNKDAAKIVAERDRLSDQLIEARRRLELEIAASAQREAIAEDKAAKRAEIAAQREAAAKERAAQREAEAKERAAQREAAAKERAAQREAAAAKRAADQAAKAAQKEALAAQKAAEKKAAAEEKAQRRRMKEATHGFDRAKTRMSEIALGSIIYNTLGQAIVSMTKYVGAALKSNDQFSASFARLKGALLTAFQPIYEVVLPALISLMNVLSAVITVIGRFFAALAGKNYSQMQKNAEALHAQAGGIGAVGAAAKKAKRELAGFDEINKLSFPDASSGGGGGGAGIGEIGADFSDPEDIANLNQILYLVGAVAAALAGWKIAKLFTDDLSTVAGVSMAIGGAFLMAANWADAFANGIDWDNLSGMMAGFALVVGGLAIAFGATGAAVGLLIGGVALVVLAVKEWIETGELGEEACAALVIGISAIGIAISLLTGGPLPAIIAAVAAFVIACVTNGDKVKGAFNKVLDWIKGFFLRDWREVFGDTLGSILNGFSEGAVGIIDGLKQAFGGLVDFVKGVFTGDWKLAWQGLQNIVKGIFNGIIGAVNGLVSGCCNGLNALIRAINKINFTIPEWVPSYGGKKIGFNLREVSVPSIPYLANGTVIPGGNPFLAVLGDQKRGQTNIEAPLPTIKQAVAEVIGDLLPAMMAGFEAVVAQQQLTREAVENIDLDGETLSKAIDRYNRKMSVMRGG